MVVTNLFLPFQLFILILNEATGQAISTNKLGMNKLKKTSDPEIWILLLDIMTFCATAEHWQSLHLFLQILVNYWKKWLFKLRNDARKEGIYWDRKRKPQVGLAYDVIRTGQVYTVHMCTAKIYLNFKERLFVR